MGGFHISFAITGVSLRSEENQPTRAVLRNSTAIPGLFVNPQTVNLPHEAFGV